MYLLIDDERTFGCDIIARTAEAGQKILKALYKEIDTLGIDHDLGSFVTTGHTIVEDALEGGYCPKHVQIISMSPVGRRAIENLLLEYGYEKGIDGTYFLPKS